MFRDRPITVLVADDSAFMRTALTRMIESDPGIKVVATARDGIEAVEKVIAVQPEVVTLDVEMPRLGGLEALQQIMQKAPRPVIIVSSLTQEGAEATLNALDLGAFDCIPKQLSYACLDIVKIRQLLINQIRAAADMPSVTRAAHPVFSPTAPLPPPDIAPLFGRHRAAIVAIGTSTGGPKALQQVLPLLPGDLPAGIVVVQHMPIGFTGPFARRLDGLCKLSVREAAQDDRVEPGGVLIAPAGWHLTIYRRTFSTCAVRLAKTPAGTLHMPSVDVMMRSVAEVFGASAMGVIMTGMGSDGCDGMTAIHRRGGSTLGQDEASCAVYGMPRSCAELGILDRSVPLRLMAQNIEWATAEHSPTRAQKLAH